MTAHGWLHGRELELGSSKVRLALASNVTLGISAQPETIPSAG